MAVNVDIKALFEAGAHFGHKTARWNPKMAPFIHSKRQDSHIINLDKTVEQLEKALPFITETASRDKQILFVGTKRQAREIVRAAAESVGQPYVVERWLGGMLTNAATISSQIKKLKLLERKMASGELAARYNKLEVQRYQEQIDLANQKYGGIKEMHGKPGAIFITDVLTDKNAVSEAKKLGIPIVAMVDSNADPTGIAYPIPANDDAIATIKLICEYVAQAVKDGEAVAAKKADVPKNNAEEK
ncbi:MAG: 30S ribosomal protein S2 [Candidatus Nomurabacteria bacterium]|jgi:small subunit ribosomal protein S2|nr:30S ribosomal protein S2 [Candidatus Nomurabacteria bacterium]